MGHHIKHQPNAAALAARRHSATLLGSDSLFAVDNCKQYDVHLTCAIFTTYLSSKLTKIPHWLREEWRR